MLRRDYILNEANKLAKLIAKLMGLQTEGNGDEFRANFDEALQEEYDLELAELTDMPEAEFSQRIKNADYSQEKLNALSQMLYMSAEPFEPTEQTASLLRKVMIIFDELEATHHFESFENLNKRSHIYTFFKRTMKDLKWKTLSTTYVHKGPWATLRADKCEMPDGTIVDEYYVLEYPNWANAVALTENNKIIMIRQYRHAAGIVSLEIPGGVIEEGEDNQAGMRRELLEETGYEFTDVELISTVYANPSTAGNVTYCYLARGGRKVQGQTLDEHEQIEVMEYTIDEVKQLLADNKIPQSLHCTGLFYALMRLGELK